MKKLHGTTKMFMIGALGYGLIELLWRGRTHWSMLTAGGVCFVILGKLSCVMKKIKPFFRCIIGSGIITIIELIYGVIFNIALKKRVWDYSKLPFNFRGQICLRYSAYWALLCIPFMPIANRIYCALVKKDTV